MVWTDWGRTPSVERADMDGSSRQVLARDGLGWPNGITVDTRTQRVIWVDAKTEVYAAWTTATLCFHRGGRVSALLYPYARVMAKTAVDEFSAKFWDRRQ